MADSSPLAHSPTLSAAEPHGGTEQLVAGTKVGDYVVDRFIGSGAMGEVYAGKHPVIGKRVAIKVLRHELAASAEAAERFIREARAVNQVDHDNVIDVFAFGRLDDGRLYLVMDLVEGRSLRAHLVDGPLPIDQALDILDTIADALDAAHDKGVVHRDLKPDNIVLSSATPPKVFVLDFGIAKLVSKANEGDAKTGPGTLTGQGTWLGTPSYMAPEQWSVDGAGPASDRYALGIIAFELLSGAPPFSATSVPGMMEQHFRAQVPALSTRGAIGVPPSVDAILEKALSKDPDKRFASAKEFVGELRAAAGTGVHRARGAVEKSSTNRSMVPAIAGVGVLGVAFAAYMATRGGDKPTVTPTPNEPAVQPGQISIEIVSSPPGAEVKTDHVVGTTPMTLPLAPGVQVTLTVSKPGYLPDTKTVRAEPDGAHLFTLTQVTGFNGTWRMKNGELRVFERTGDQVDVYKVTEVAGAREFFKHYKFTAIDKGIAFAAEDEVIDPRKPDDPSCHVPVRVEYRYDPQADVLELRREKVNIDLHQGSCVVRARNIESDLLVHVDQAADEVVISAPAGDPRKLKKQVLPKDPQADLEKKQKLEEAKKAEAAKNVKPTAKTNVGQKQAVSDKNADPFGSAPQKGKASYSQIAPEPQVNAPMNTAEPQEQQQALPPPQQQKK
ncbi:MAG TPA: serine/threonine-protein kinase [Kofleriaceae bacterium]|nr:serine/threonine-protein kinase [Kofleriaceae bacterium]